MYDYWLGGKDNLAQDRKTAKRIEATARSMPRAARANRGFMERAVRFCVQKDIRQFVDLGMGFPMQPNVAQIAREHQPDVTVVGVDNNRVVVLHQTALANGPVCIDADIRRPQAIMSHPDPPTSKKSPQEAASRNSAKPSTP